MNEPPRARAHVLIVDDDAALTDQLEEVLRTAGYDVKVAENGRAALDALNVAPPPGMILLDLLMPELDGFSLLKLLRADPTLGRIPVCVMSSLSVDVLRPADATTLRKPIDIDRLLLVVARHCGPGE